MKVDSNKESQRHLDEENDYDVGCTKDKIFMEEFLYDLCNSDKLTSEISCELYDTEKTLQVFGDFLKLLKFDNSDATKYIKSKLEQCVTSNKFLQSLFIENNKNNFKRTT